SLTAGRSADFYVVFHPASGLPMPTGEFSIWLGQSHTMLMTLGSTGANLVHIDKIPVLAGVSNIEIFYPGDLYYAPSSVDFPLTNLPIPSGAGSGGTGSTGGSFGSNPKGTPATTATAATADSDTTTPTVAVAANAAPTTHASSGDNGALWLIVILALVGLIVVGGAVGAGIFLMRRARISAGIGPRASRDFYVPPSYVPPHDGTWPPLYEDR
ncbi:MAG TPA: hypothetical protein VFS83_00005, partial [Ktedonobacterales bacterium]|nr:hypothetical protein [Ktedonobacterales bacterium]